MAQFRIGMRVRVKDSSPRCAIGCEGFITGHASASAVFRGYYDWLVMLPSQDRGSGPNGEWGFRSDQLEPILDTSADQFLARIKKLGSEPVNDAPKVTVREGK